ncbi:unnamed protein product [Xylocopa violacea]|uniref:Uncharacterized protein n=1 Tax=Xylocopa violacea TaxID=135666 RepID=A0ABP1NIY7_XYLVO
MQLEVPISLMPITVLKESEQMSEEVRASSGDLDVIGHATERTKEANPYPGVATHLHQAYSDRAEVQTCIRRSLGPRDFTRRTSSTHGIILGQQ